jgi:hypothetical protein
MSARSAFVDLRGTVPKKLSRALQGQADAALAGEAALARSIVQSDPSSASPGVLLVTRTRLVHVDAGASTSWPLEVVAIADYGLESAAQPAGLSVLAGDDLLRLFAPRGRAAGDLDAVVTAVRRLHTDIDNEPAAARLSELPWWERKAAWPLPVLGRIAGGTTTLTQGERGSLGLGRRGASLYLAGRAEPTLQLPWQEVTGVLVEDADGLAERLTPGRARALGVLDWGMDTKAGPSFVTVTTKTDELYFAAQAPAAALSAHWVAVLSQFTDEEVVVLAVAPEQADLVVQLERLAALRASGALNDDEYATAKAAVLRAPGA